MPFDGIRVLTFDVVGTLIDFETGILDCLRPLTRVDDTALLESFARAEAAQASLTPELPFTQMLAPIYGRMAEELDLPEHAGLRESIPRWPAFPDAPQALRDLGRRFRLVALTNTDNWALARMNTTLGSPFDDTVTAEDVGVNKPDPQMFAYCLGRQSVHGYTRDDCLHVAQSQYHDIGIAAELGYRTCWIERRHGRSGFGATPEPRKLTTPDHHFTTLRELAAATSGFA
ncbi:HAD-IA family hydrolase [Prauserella muralis]|uniref:HAD family hydrolase n=1 Tax=Prauserella muralis TaxID=588067 RepID=A0A2V4B0Y2_9PSEU|nr:HAD-IA family hydrolase [Prauserella muralis]PXY27677.1 HAD family hydrolase [Prauserella muralis]TWE22585.1 putative hydrolase of the HAD superfamily [Prauserella muralis]